MKRYFAAAIIAAMTVGAAAQTVQIKTAKGDVKTYSLSQIESITFSDEDNEESLVSFDVVNASAYAFDIKVDKSASCQKYMVAVYNKNVFNENTFIEGAEQTLQPDAYYRPFEKTLSYDSSLLPESSLGINDLTGDGDPTFVAAVYAVDDLGSSKVYTKEFTLPSSPTIESTEQATVTIDKNTLRYNHVEYSVRSGWNTAKIIIGVTQPNYIDNKLTVAKWNSMTKEEQQTKLMGVFQGLPETYKSGMKGSYDCNANSTCIVYAIPIDYNGKIGKFGIETVNTGAVPVDGKGAFTSVAAVEQTAWDSYTFNVEVDNNSVAYRLMWFTETDEKNSDYTKRLPELFYDTKYQDYGTWREFSCEETSPTLDVFRPSENYYLFGVTVDRFGNISQPVNLLERYIGKKTISTMSKPADED